eukprot:TRINITY_DN10760_c0_g1_i2.p1 TRINITY_DN10760_c0_g1~~TRINITY_DN10760_c0_g1_i2.p1  ORF type:complete len:246 (-),score=86.62 TRINITY_DN10760_c0_g1_i2:37-774(-)
MAGLVKSLRGRLSLPVFRAVSVKPTKAPIISRLASINISQGSSIAITSSPLCSRMSQVTVPGTQLLSRWCHNESKEAEKEIYNGILSTQIKLVKSFSLMTSFIGIAFQPILYTYSSANAAVVLGAGAFLSFFTFATPLLIHSVSKKYVTKLYYNQVEDKYTAVVYNIFIRPKKIEFKVNDVEVPDIPGMFTTFKANSVPLFVEGSQFNDITHYGKIMGYDKPIDLMWDKDLDMTKSAAEAMRKKM